MTETISHLAALIERVKAATEPDEKLDRAVAAALNDPWSNDEEDQFGGYDIMPRRVRYSASIDDALALVERVLPKWFLDDLKDDRKPQIFVGDKHDSLGTFTCRLQHYDGGRLREATASTAPLAILAALLTALERG